MNMCSSGHEEIVYDDNNCPLCEALASIAELEDEIGELEAKIEELEDAE